MVEIPSKLQHIFSFAVALEQNGRLRNTIYCHKQTIYVINQDHTVIIRFPIKDIVVKKDGDLSFENPVAFRANEFEGKWISIEKDKICFHSKDGSFTAVKKCVAPSLSFEEIDAVFIRHMKKKDKRFSIEISRGIWNHLDESLSHIEFRVKKHEWLIVQRNIFDGSVRVISKTPSTSEDVSKQLTEEITPQTSSKLPRRMGAIAVRSGDLRAMFEGKFKGKNGSLHLIFEKKKPVILIDNSKSTGPNDPKFQAIIATCIYDELRGKI